MSSFGFLKPPPAAEKVEPVFAKGFYAAGSRAGGRERNPLQCRRLKN